MKIRTVFVQVSGARSDYGIAPRDLHHLRNCAEVLSWKLTRWVQPLKLELPNAGRFEILATSQKKGEVFKQTDIAGKCLLVGIPTRPEQITNPQTTEEAYDMLYWLVQEGRQRIESRLGFDLSSMDAALEELANDGFTLRLTLAERRPRGLGLTFRIEGLANDRAFMAWFVILRDGEEIHREVLMHTNVFMFRRYGHLGKIDFDGETISLPHRIFSNFTGAKLQSAQMDTQERTGKPLEDYAWSRKLSELVS